MKFTGHERDDLTGLDYMKARYSGWFQASFLIPDPANDVNPRNPQSWNRYAYVRNNPMNLVDPSGMIAEDKASTVISKDPCGTNNGGGATCDDRGLKARNDDASKKADEANQKEEGKDPAAEQSTDDEEAQTRRINSRPAGPEGPTITFENDEPGKPSPDQPVSRETAKMVEDVVVETGLSININSTTGGKHSPSSRHPLGMAVDINRIGGKPVSQVLDDTTRLQEAFNEHSHIRENFGPALNTKTLGDGTRVEKPGVKSAHKNHIHVSGQR
jgi:RHS repeat-associated protein